MTLGEEGESGISIGDDVCFTGRFIGSLSLRMNPVGLGTWFTSPNKYVLLSLYLRLPGEETVRLRGLCPPDSPSGACEHDAF